MYGLACVCDPRGTEGSGGDCNTATSTHATNDNVCPCKVLVNGSTCNTCNPGYYNLSAAHDNGCEGNTLIVFNCHLLVQLLYRMFV